MQISAGTLTIRTDVAGSASRAGHRLVIAVDEWSADVDLEGGRPVAVTFQAGLASLRVESGSGGLTPLSPVDKQVIKRNALKSLDAARYPEVTFKSDWLEFTDERLEVSGTLTIHGVGQALTAALVLTDGRATASVPVCQTDFGIKPYSLMFGQLRVADEVVVELDVEVPQ
jgi:polyisoprenoid-binding protein YceI